MLDRFRYSLSSAGGFLKEALQYCVSDWFQHFDESEDGITSAFDFHISYPIIRIVYSVRALNHNGINCHRETLEVFEFHHHQSHMLQKHQLDKATFVLPFAVVTYNRPWFPELLPLSWCRMSLMVPAWKRGFDDSSAVIGSRFVIEGDVTTAVKNDIRGRGIQYWCSLEIVPVYIVDVHIIELQ
ncbi:hypothetical protein Tco_0232561 [Tanacetum coccineum]